MTRTVKAIRTIERTSKTIFWLMLAMLVCLGIVYMYFVNKTIWNIALREKMQAEMVSYNSKLGDREFEYIKSKGSITLNSAEERGFEAPQQISFVTKEVVQTVAMK